MEKNLLSEVNRAREIMGLELIAEAYDVKEEGEVKYHLIDWVNKYLKKNGVRGMAGIKGYNKLQQLYGAGTIRGYNVPGDSIDPQMIVIAILQHYGEGNVKKGLKRLFKYIKHHGLKTVQRTVAINYKDGTSVATHGDVKQGKVDTTGNRAMNNQTPEVTLVRYLNGFNIGAYSNNKNLWEISQLKQKGFINFMNGPKYSRKEPWLILYASTKGAKQEAGTDTEETVVQGYEATGRYDTDYSSGDSTPDGKLVEKAVNEIGTMFPADVVNKLNIFTLKAGASANWGTEKLPNSSGKGNTGFAEGNEGKNQKLAFDRGDKFMKEVNKGLKAGGHPGFDNYEVNWVVEGQKESDQFIDLMLNYDKEDIIVTKTIDTIKGERTKGAGKGKLFTLFHTVAGLA